ncbi:MAG: S8 family serine peptidase [Deltaproteobacteria bacterium]|nr:S8 family serine peptidase [Deltaproteobacteria bacterium]
MKKQFIFVLDLLIIASSLTFGLKGYRVWFNQVEAIKVHVRPNDPGLQKSWVFNQKDALDALDAWKIERGNKKVIVAIVDTGVDTTHPDITANLWKNPGENGSYIDPQTGKIKNKENDGIDNDGNGFVDDVHGWDFSTSSHHITDEHGHGTHVAGIIGAQANNAQGISGVSPQVSLMILKYYDAKASGSDNLKNSIKALEYAVRQGAHIINYSGGGPQYVKEEFVILKEAEEKGILIVAAAGNEASDIGERQYFPASYELSNILSVASIDQEGHLASSSNYGKKVDVAAPGESIYSTLPLNKGGYGLMTGTSQATAFVSGVAALVLSQNLSWVEKKAAPLIKNKIQKSVKKLSTLTNKVLSGGKVSALKALENNI